MSDDPQRDWINTYTGVKAYPLAMTVDMVNHVDIAHALSNLCRYTGHCTQFYSVAEHCCHVSDVVPREYALVGLVHDAAEAYVCDVANPLKYTKEFEFYRVVEKVIEEVIARTFNLIWPWPDCIKAADLTVLEAEVQQVVNCRNEDWLQYVEPADIIIRCWPPAVAKRQWLERFYLLTTTGE